MDKNESLEELLNDSKCLDSQNLSDALSISTQESFNHLPEISKLSEKIASSIKQIISSSLSSLILDLNLTITDQLATLISSSVQSAISKLSIQMTSSFTSALEEMCSHLNTYFTEGKVNLNITNTLQSYSNLLSQSKIENDTVIISNEDYETIKGVSEILDEYVEDDIINNKPVKKITLHPLIKNILAYIFHIIIPMIIPIMHSQYLHDMDSLESQKQQLETAIYEERKIQLEEEFSEMISNFLSEYIHCLNSDPYDPLLTQEFLQHLIDSLKSVPEVHENPFATDESLPEASDELDTRNADDIAN